MRILKETREGFIHGVCERMAFEDAATLECAIQGYDVETIEKQLGSMSINQWRACLEISLNDLIFKTQKRRK